MSRTSIKLLPLLALAGLLAGCGGHHNANQSNNSATNSNNGAMNNSNGTASKMNQTAAPAAGTVLVTVNGTPITASEVNAYVMLRTHGQKIQLNAEQRYQIAKQLIQVNLAAQAARKENLMQKPDIRAGLDLQRKLYLANQFVENYQGTAKVPESKLKSEYKQMAAAQSGKEYKARHILVKKEAEAKKIIGQLNQHKDSATLDKYFATLAKKDSTGPSAKQGGELGWFKPKQMVPAFSAALEKLKKGHYTEKPVKSKFGWHVILLEDERTSAPPSYTASKPMLERQAQDTMLRDNLNKLRSQASIDWKVPNPASAAKAQPKLMPAATGATAAPKPATH
ncbi:MAG: peptidylprolyl isomerase [Gammaproteobacteria bacterium]